MPTRRVFEAVLWILHTGAHVDASFARAKSGGAGVGDAKAGKGMKIMAIVDHCGLPLSLSTQATNPHELTLV